MLLTFSGRRTTGDRRPDRRVQAAFGVVAAVGGVASLCCPGASAAAAAAPSGATGTAASSAATLAQPSYPTLHVSGLLVGLIALYAVEVAVLARWLLVHRRVRNAAPLEALEQPAQPDPPFAPIVAVLTAVSLVLMLAHAWRWFQSDDSFLFFWNPSKGLAQFLTVWDPQHDLGGPHEYYTPIPFIFTGVLRAFGIAPWLVQRFFMAALLVTGSVGTALVVRQFRPRWRVAQLVAGLWFISSPYTVGFLFPTGLYLNAALCPWLIIAFLRGTTTTARWRWAGVFALVVAVSGTINVPALVLVSLPLFVVAVALLFSHRSTLRAMLGWAVRAGALITAILLPAFFRVVLASQLLSQNLARTESAQAVSQSSSWPETLRGLGSWLLYWNPRGPLLVPYVTPYLTNAVVIICSFVPVVAAFVVLGWSRQRYRLVFGAIVLVCATVMVGGFRTDRPSPFGSLLLNTYKWVPATFALRNVYKAGAGLVVAIAVLLGIAAQWVADRLKARPLQLAAAFAVLGVVVLTSAAPLWTGGVFHGTERLHGSPPAYWTEALHWLDAQPGATRVLFVPSGVSADYRWGATPGGDMFPALLARPFAFSAALSETPPDALNAIVALDAELTSGHYEAGTLAPIARRLGLEYLVIRNDLDWQTLGTARPAKLATLRSDPGLERVATFGAPGQNVVRGGDPSSQATAERQLPPVEILRVPGSTEPVRAVATADDLLVAGDGAAWPALARAGRLDSSGPVRYTGRLDHQALSAEVEHGAQVVISDTNRRRAAAFFASDQTLTAAQTDQAGDLFGVPGSQSVVAYGDAISITDVGPPRLFTLGVAARPAAAFDGDPRTSWLTGLYTVPVPEALEVVLNHPATISSMTLVAAKPPGGRILTGVSIVFPDGTVPVDLSKGETTVTFPPRTTNRFEIAVRSVAGGGGGPYGLADVRVPGLDLAERVQLPDDVMRGADGDPTLAHGLALAPLSYDFERLHGGVEDEEPTLRRRFRMPSARTLVGGGTVSVTATTPAEVSALLGSAAATGACRDDLLSVDGRSVRTAVKGSPFDLLAGKPVPLTLCAPLDLTSGWHEVIAQRELPLNDLTLTTTPSSSVVTAPATPVPVVVASRSATAFKLRVTGPKAGVGAANRLILGQGSDPHWTASTRGGSLGRVTELDAQAGWMLDRGGDATVTVVNSAQRPYTVTLWLSALALFVALVVVVADPRSAPGRPTAASQLNHRLWAGSFDVAVVLFGFGIGGFVGAFVCAACVIASRQESFPARALAVGAAALMALAVLATVPPLGPALHPLGPQWPEVRSLAQFSALTAVEVLAAMLSALARSEGPKAEPTPTARTRPPSRERPLEPVPSRQWDTAADRPAEELVTSSVGNNFDG